MAGKDQNLEQFLDFLFVSLFVGLQLSLKEAQSLEFNDGGYNTTVCYDNHGPRRTCFTTFYTNNSRPVRMHFNKSNDWCKANLPGSSLITVNSQESQKIVETFIEQQANETIFMNGHKQSASDSLKWSWVNGHPTDQIGVVSRSHNDMACVELENANLLAYCYDTMSSPNRYICEYSELKSVVGYRLNNKSYVASKGEANWYDARNECLRLGGDLASITNLQTIKDWSLLKENPNQRFWIGLYRIKWIWNSTGDALIYTNWQGGFPDDSVDRECICINRQCPMGSKQPICDNRKWSTCSCDQHHVIVCQNEEHVADSVTTEIIVSFEMSGIFNSFNGKEILLIPLLLVVFIFIIVAIFLILRRRKHDRRNEGGTSTNDTKLSGSVSFTYAKMAPGKRPSQGTVPHGCTIVKPTHEDMTELSTTFNNIIYASVQLTDDTVGLGKSVDYVELEIIQKDQQKPKKNDEATDCLNPIYSQPYKPHTSTSDTDPRSLIPALGRCSATGQPNSRTKAIPLGDPKAVHSEPNVLTVSSRPASRKAKTTDLIYHDAIEVRSAVVSGDDASGDQSAIYAVPFKAKQFA